MEDTEKADSGPIPTNEDASTSQGISCALCGCAAPAVRCDRCNSQIFCLSCDDMYHRHPKRKLHLRKAVDSIWSSARSPRLRRNNVLPGDPSKIPIPPPRAKKRDRHAVGRIFLKSGLELGSFGHSKVFDPKSLPTSKDFFTGQKSPASLVESNCDDTSSPIKRSESAQIYENDNVTPENLNDRSPWNTLRPNISSPIQVSIPSSSPDIVANGQSFGYPMKPHSQSAADLTGHSGPPIGHQPYHFHPPYPYMHPPMHPYSHSMAHLNCAQCISSSWSNLISPHPSPFFHPMPWGSAQNTMPRHPVPGQPGPMKHSHGDLPSFPESGFHYPYPGGGYYPNGPPVVDPNFIKDLHEQAEMQKTKREVAESKSNPANEEMDAMENPAPATSESAASNAVTSAEATTSANRDVKEADEVPVIPEKPTEPWTCVHCTYINPPGSYICEVCCKTSYGNKPSADTEEQSEMRSLSRDSESPLINRDALMNSPAVSELRDAQKDDDEQMELQISESVSKDETVSCITPDSIVKLTTETQTFTTTKTTDVQTQNISRKSMASSTDSIFPKQEISVQTEEAVAQTVAVATDPMISSQSLESLLSGVSAPPYHNRRAGWGRGATSFSTQSLYDRGRSRSPMPRSLSFHTESPNLGRDSSFASEEAMRSISQTWLYSDPMYYKPRYQGLGQTAKEDYFDGTWGSMDKLDRRIHKKEKGKVEHFRSKLHRSLDDLKSEKRAEPVPIPELMMLQTVKEAERLGYTLEDLHVAYLHCNRENPVYWLEDNWPQMVKNVIALAAKYGEDNEENDVGVITASEAKEALRIHRGDIWDAVTECIENRQRKILELTVRGNFTQKQISEALKNNDGNVELAYADLLRQSTRRHKFILSPGLSTDSEDLNLYNPIEDSAVDHLSVSPVKAAKVDAAGESKTEKKKSDFFTKLTAIREAQSERRKAREEKELIRETITQDFPTASESNVPFKDKDLSIELTPSISREDSKEVEETVQEKVSEVSENVNEALEETKAEVEITNLDKGAIDVKEGAEDNLPVDFDSNWSESQGEWIEEYCDEQWVENDEHWVGIDKKYEKMEKEYEEEAMQMAALWEKEELEDDVFEEEAKTQDEVTNSSDKKFDEWVKANLKVDSSEYEEEVEMKEKPFSGNITDISIRERLELEGSQPSPLQHYPTAFDLSVKSQFESDWESLPADAEIEKLAHDIVCEGSDIESKEDADMAVYEDEKKIRKISDLGSDEDWEKIEMDEQLHEINELDQLAFPEKESELEKDDGLAEKDIMKSPESTSQILISEEQTVLYKNLEDLSVVEDLNEEIITSDSQQKTSDKVSVDQEIYPVNENEPKPPVRRRSKLNSWAIEEALKNHLTSDNSSDIPPALPEKMKHKDVQPVLSDIYAIPDKKAKTLHQEYSNLEIKDTKVPQKPPRLNLSPLSPLEADVPKIAEVEREPEVLPKVLPKDGSPVTPLSYESDSNFFADSESDTEIRLHKQKNVQRKSAKYANEQLQDNGIALSSKEEIPPEEKSDLFEPNLDLELDDDIDPALIEPLPRMKDIDYDPELPILMGGRGRQLINKDDVNAPKAFREDTARPLQLFKATKRETPTNLSTPSSVMVEQSSDFNQMSNESMPEPISNNQMAERYYYNETIASQQSLNEIQIPEKQEIFEQIVPQKELISEIEIEQEIEQAVQPTSVEEEEIAFTEGLSAVSDYFFGQYNEVIVTPPKKKGTLRSKSSATSTDKSAASSNSKVLSTSEIISTPKLGSLSQMEQSAAAVLQEEPQPDSAISDIKPKQQNQLVNKQINSKSAASKEETPVSEKQKPPPPIECLSFAEDYLFGAYNQVVVPKKTRNVPVVLAVIPKLGASLHRSPHKEEKTLRIESTPEPPEQPSSEQEEEVEEEMEEEVPESEENTIATDISAVYDDVFHDLPSEMLSNQSFDESSIYYESFQDAVEDIQESVPVSSSVVNMRPKSVHFEDPQVPVAPPRKHKPQGMQKARETKTVVSSESYGDDYLYRQYGTQSLDKKKLPECSEDFKMNQGFESTEIPCDVPIMPDEQKEGVISSETSVDIPLKSPESLKYSSESEFGVSEQSLNSVSDSAVESKTVKTTLELQSMTQNINNSSIDVTTNSEITSCELPQDVKSTEIQSEKSESFENISSQDLYEEVLSEPSVVSCDLIKENVLIPNILSSSLTEYQPQLNNAQISQSSNINTNESNLSSDTYDIDQFVFIDQAQNIINDESYHLYDMQESLVGDLSYINIKGNIEDECTDDSEQEWKRNEDRKNTLNASFLKTSSDQKDSDEHLEISDESEKLDLVDSKNIPCPDVESNNEESIFDVQSIKSDAIEEDHSKSLESSSHETSVVKLVKESESIDTNENSIKQAYVETQKADDKTFEDVNKLTEKIDERLPIESQISENLEKVIDDTIENLSKIDEEFESKLPSSVDEAQIISQKSKSFEKLSDEIIENLPQTYQNTLSKDSFETEETQSYLSITESDSVLTETAIEDSSCLVERNKNIMLESFVESDGTLSTLNVKLDGSVENLSQEITESLAETNQDFTPNLSDNTLNEIQVLSESDKDLSKETIQSPSETNDEALMLMTSNLADSTHEKIDANRSSFGTTDSSTISERHVESSEKIEIDESIATVDDLFISDDQEVEMPDDVDASSELSDDNLSSHSSVSTQIAISLKTNLKESEGDDGSLYSEQIENFEDNEVSEISLSLPVSSERILEDERQNFEIVSEDEGLKNLDEILKFSKHEEQVSEMEHLDFGGKSDSIKDKSELTPTPSFESDPQDETEIFVKEFEELPSMISESSIEKHKNVSEDQLKEFSLDSEIDASQEDTITTLFDSKADVFQSSVDEKNDESLLESFKDLELIDRSISIQSSIISGDEDDTNKKDYVDMTPSDLSVPDALCSEVQPQVNVDTEEIAKLDDIKNDEIDSESLMAEGSIMSRFYDEWYQNVESSNNFTYLSAESIYAKYGAAESSESGNESDHDNALIPVSCDGDTQDIQKESLRDITTLNNQYTEKEEGSVAEELTVKRDESYAVNLCHSSNVSEHLKIKETNEVEISQNDMSAGEEVKLQQDQFVSKPEEEEFVVQHKFDELIKEQEEFRTVNDSKINESIQPLKDSEVIDSRHEKSKFSTSKSCQTEDSFEEDIFFDSFDDTFTIPSYLHIPIEEQTKPSTSDMSIQCELISIDEILSTKKISGSVPQIGIITPEAHASVSIQNCFEEPKMKGEHPSESDLASEEKEESSCESFEDTDSDIFIESPSSQDELDVGVKKSFLYAEVDSDTGFSSGSEYGWTKKNVLKEKEIKKGVKSLVTVIDSQQKSCTSEKESASSSQIYVEESVIDDSQEKVIETCNESKENMNKENDFDKSQQVSEIASHEARVSPLPREIIERAVTPIAIPQFPSFDEDLVFVEIPDYVEEAADDRVEKVISTSATVEYFYGPLPETVKIESPSNEGYFETASEFSEPLSFPIDRTESFSESISSLQTADPEVPGQSDVESEILSQEKNVEDESFADTMSSSKEMDESISEYFALPESSISTACSLSIAESDVFDLAQTEITPDTGYINVITSLELDSKEKERLVDKKLQPSDSEITKDINFIKELNKVDEASQEISLKNNVNVNKEIVTSDALIGIQSKIESLDKVSHEERSEILYSEKTNIDDIHPEAVTNICASNTVKEKTTDTEHFVVSRSELTDNSDKSDLSKTNESELALSDFAVPSSDLPPKPSDIVRYLYYNDSITFDEDSYFTQSENVGVPSLAAEEVMCVDLPSEEIVSESIKCVTAKVPDLLPDQPLTHEEKLTPETLDTFTNDVAENIKLVQESSESTPHRESAVLEISKSEKLKEIELEKDDKVSERVIEPSSEPKTFLQSDETKDIVSSCESDLKFPIVEVIASENVTVLPVTEEEIHVPVVPIEEIIPESVTVINTPIEERSTISEDSEFQDVPQIIFKQSRDIPSAPSDIVRYLYYDDDFTYDETTQSSFHSHSNNNASDLGSDDVQPQFADFELFEDRTGVDTKPDSSLGEENIFLTQLPELQQKTSLELSKETNLETSTTSHEQSSYKLDSSSAKDESILPVDSSEFIEDWFDLEEVDHKKKNHDSEQFSSTKSSALKDSAQACIPEYILSPKFDNGIAIGKTDIDEITDISTHFTMTDDSDKFSDIESDISLNLEEECVLPIEFSDPMMLEIKEFENVYEEMGVCTPKVKNIEGGFQFVSSDASKEKNIESAVLEEFQDQKYYDRSSVTSSDLVVHHSVESRESLSENLNEVNLQNLGEESIEKSDECISSTDFSEISREHFVECPVKDEDSFKDISGDHAEAFDECITSTDFFELPKQPDELSTLNEYLNQPPNQDIEQCLLEEKNDECIIVTDSSKMLEGNLSACLIPSESIGPESTEDVSLDQKIENFDECITSPDFSEISKEQFLECLSDDLTHTESSKDIVPECPEEAFNKHDVSKEDLERLKEQFEECPTTASEVCVSQDCDEAFDECITSTDFSELSNKQLGECTTLNEYFDQSPNQDIEQSQPIPILTHTESSEPLNQAEEASDKSDAKDSERVKEQFVEHPTTATEVFDQKPCEKANVLITAPESFVSDENGNYPHLASKENFAECSTKNETQIISEESNIKLQEDNLKTSFADNNEENGISCYALPENSVFGEQFSETPEISSQVIEITSVETDDDLEISCYTAPNEDSHSISPEVTENWSDAESKNIDIDESVYDLPQECFNDTIVKNDSCEKAVSKVSETSIDKFESFSCETNLVKFAEADTFLSKSQKEIAGALDKISDSDEKINAYTPSDSFQQDSSVPSFSSKNIPSDISDVKMETQSEISSAVKEIHIECMSTTSGVEPIFSPGGTMYDTQEVHPKEINFGDICQEEGVVEDARKDISSCSEITGHVDTELITSTYEEGISEASESDILKAVDLKFSDIDAESERESYILKITKSDETKAEKVPLIVDSKELTSESHAENEFISTVKNNDINKREEIYKEIEIVDFKFVDDNESVIDNKLADSVTVLPDLNLSRTEVVDFKMGNIESVSSGIQQKTRENEEAVSLKEDFIVKKENSDIATNGVSLKADDFVNSKTVKQALPKSLVSNETVDFKGSPLIDKDPSFCQVQESSIEISVKQKSEKIDNQPSEIVDFKLISDQYSDNSNVTKEDIDEKKTCILKESTLKSSETCSLEVVDFKGQFIISPDLLEVKKENNTQDVKEVTHNSKTFETVYKEKEIPLEKTKNADEIPKITQIEESTNFAEKRASFVQSSSETCFETVDFKGQLYFDPNLSEKEKDISSTLTHRESELVEKSEISIKEKDEKLSKSEEMCIPSSRVDSLTIVQKIDSIESNEGFETVDFRGGLICSSELNGDKLANTEEMRTMIEEPSKELQKVDVPSQIADSTEFLSQKEKDFARDISETESKSVDFKGIAVSDKTPIQLEKREIPKDIKVKSTMTTMIEGENVESSMLKTMDLERSLHSTAGKLDQESIGSDIVSSTDVSVYQDMYEEMVYETDMVERYTDYIPDVEPVYDLRDTYGYATAEQLVPNESSGYITEENVYFDETSVESAGFSISAEGTNELYSCVETLSTDEDTSLQFNSVSDGLEDSLNVIMSEEFTDVPSHFTSTEGSDVESDIFFEDTELDRDKTPIRTLDEINVLKKETVDAKISEEKIALKSFDTKDENAYTSANEKDIVQISENIVQHLGDSPKKENETEIHEIETVKNFQIVTETEIRTSSLEENESSKNIESVEVESLILKEKKEKSDETMIVIKKEIKSENAEKLLLPSNEDISSIDSKVSLQTSGDIEPSLEKSSDHSVFVGGVNTDLALNEFLTEKSEKRSAIENVTEYIEKESCVSITTDTKMTEVIPKDNKIDQVLIDKTIKQPEVVEENDNDTTGSLTEHFADVKAIKDQSSTVDTFSSLDAETAVSKTHEDTSTDISSQFEKTESEPWLDAETEHSVSEVGEDIAVCIKKDGDTKVVFVGYEKGVDEVETVIQSSETPYASTSSSYSDLGSSDQTSDTCADISLQGATTENSDKWSDIESEGLIDEVLYGNADIPETADLTDLSHLKTKFEENKSLNEIFSKIEGVQSNPETATENIALPVVEEKNKEEDFSLSTVSKSNLMETSESFSLVESPDSSSVNITDSRLTSIQTESTLSSLTSSAVITTGMSDDELTSVTPLDVTTEESDKWSDISGDTSEIDEESSVSLKASLKLQELDSVSSKIRIDLSSGARLSVNTKENVETAEADDSVKGIDDDSLVSIKAASEIQESSDVVLSDSKADKIEKDQNKGNVEDIEKLEVSEDTSPKESITCKFLTDKEKHALELQQCTIDSESSKRIAGDKETSKSANLVSGDSKSLEIPIKQLEANDSIVSSDEVKSLSFKDDFKSQSEPLDTFLSESELTKAECGNIASELNENGLKPHDRSEIDSTNMQEMMKSKTLESIKSQSVEEKIEDSSSSNITEEFDTVDNFTDVPTHTSETSEGYCELDSDHSFEDTDSPLLIDSKDQDLYDVTDINNQQTSEITNQSFSEYYENSVVNDELLENLDHYSLDDIPENEFENYEEEYSLSEHFEINEDELIYPLPYNDDWIEQSFELKEYGVEAVFSESGSDIHGLGIGSEEFYDDEDIQRAIDYNLSTHEENETNIENVATSESFKTLSNDASPHLKLEEYDNWSTADAPSIVEEFDDHDDILSKIDEILAEDFDVVDNYESESPLNIEENIESDLLKNVSTPEEICDKKISEKDDSSLTKNILLERDKSKEKAESGKKLEEKDFTQVFEVESDMFSGSAAVVDSKEMELTQSKSATVEMSSEKESNYVFKKDTEAVSDKIALKSDKNVDQIESQSCKVFQDRDSKTDVLSESTTVQIDSQEVSGNQSKKESVESSLKKDPKSSLEDDFKVALKKDVEKTTLNSNTVVDKKAHKQKVEENTAVSEIKAESLLDETSVKESSSSVKATDKEVISRETTSKKASSDTLKRELDSETKEATSTKVSSEAPQKESSSSVKATDSEVISRETTSKKASLDTLKSELDFKTKEATSTKVSTEAPQKESGNVSKDISATQEVKMKSVSTSDEETIQNVQTKINKNIPKTSAKETIKTDTGEKIPKDLDSSMKEDITLSPEIVQEIPAKLQVPAPNESPDSVSLSVSKTESSLNIPCKEMPESSETLKDFSIKEKTTIELSESADIIQTSCLLNESSECSTTVSTESIKVQSNIPEQKAFKDETFNESKPLSDSSDFEVKPDIPKKIRSRTLDSKEATSTIDESDKKPSLPPKKSKRHSVSDSSSVGESLSSSSSVESVGSFESAVSGRSRKSSLKSSDETSMHSASPEVPVRRSRSSKVSSSSRSTSRDSDDSSGSVPSRSSSLKIRRRSSNFIEPEPIDLSKKRASIDERIKKLQNEGKCTSREKAFIAAKLIEMQFEEEDALLASRQCNTVYNAVKFLTQLCDMCNCRFPINLMASMVQCAHRACKECLKAHFTSLIYDRSVFTLLCPICHNSDITDQNIQDYFNHLDMTLRNILDDKVYDLFQRKLRDEVLTKDPNFHWCSQCSSGFIASPRLKKLYCPDCSAITCALCHQTWELEHEGVHCERFQQWKDMHTPEPPPAGLVKFLVDRGISCPSCGLVYAQACGGCLMYKCSHCSFEFCGFCSHPLKRGRECANEICDTRGLHIHHLHNCLFFLRDKDITEIQMLLEEESVTYLTIPPKDQIVKRRCQVREQKNNHGVLTEDRCGRDIEPYCGGLCRTHYYEYLAELLRKNNISPLSIMTIQDLQFMLRKSRILVPEKVKGETSEDYYERLLNIVTSTLT